MPQQRPDAWVTAAGAGGRSSGTRARAPPFGVAWQAAGRAGESQAWARHRAAAAGKRWWWWRGPVAWQAEGTAPAARARRRPASLPPHLLNPCCPARLRAGLPAGAAGGSHPRPGPATRGGGARVQPTACEGARGRGGKGLGPLFPGFPRHARPPSLPPARPGPSSLPRPCTGQHWPAPRHSAPAPHPPHPASRPPPWRRPCCRPCAPRRGPPPAPRACGACGRRPPKASGREGRGEGGRVGTGVRREWRLAGQGGLNAVPQRRRGRRRGPPAGARA